MGPRRHLASAKSSRHGQEIGVRNSVQNVQHRELEFGWEPQCESSQLCSCVDGRPFSTKGIVYRLTLILSPEYLEDSLVPLQY